MNSLATILLSMRENSFLNLNLNESTKKDNYDENNSDKSYDEYEEETIPDEDFIKFPKRIHKLLSCPNVEQKGPNINLKINHKRYSNQKEKKRQNSAKIMNYTMTATSRTSAALLMVSMNYARI